MGGVGKAVGKIVEPVAQMAAEIIKPAAKAAGEAVQPIFEEAFGGEEVSTPKPQPAPKPKLVPKPKPASKPQPLPKTAEKQLAQERENKKLKTILAKRAVVAARPTKTTLAKKAAVAARSTIGRGATILTSALGAEGQAPVRKKTLLGQ